MGGAEGTCCGRSAAYDHLRSEGGANAGGGTRPAAGPARISPSAHRRRAQRAGEEPRRPRARRDGAAGSVNLTTVRLLGPHLRPENHRGVLESARGKRRAEVEEIVARLAPFPE